MSTFVAIRPLRPRLAEALAIASGRAVAECAELVRRDNEGEHLLIHEYGADWSKKGGLERTPALVFPSHDPAVVWQQLVDGGLVQNASNRSFACASCDGSGKERVETPDGGMHYVTCTTCDGALVFPTPPRVTYALAFAGDFARIVKFEKRVRGRSECEIAWVITRGGFRRAPDEAAKGPHYETGKRVGQRLWAIFQEL